jgi:hypothetical protein
MRGADFKDFNSVRSGVALGLAPFVVLLILGITMQTGEPVEDAQARAASPIDADTGHHLQLMGLAPVSGLTESQK